MIAIVTDRPNVGREIARVLGADRKENGYMTGNGYMVTWTYGNMLSLAMPKDSGTARVEWKDFPLLPPSFLTVRHVKTDTGYRKYPEFRADWYLYSGACRTGSAIIRRGYCFRTVPDHFHVPASRLHGYDS